MADLQNGVIALDIETATTVVNGESIDFTDTACFELVAIGLGYQAPSSPTIESTVLFRQEGWAEDDRVSLMQRTYEWIARRDPAVVLTYNGTNFDQIHLEAWARQATQQGQWSDASMRMQSIFENHIDLHEHAMARYQHMLQRHRTGISLERICDWENIDLAEVPIDRSKFADVDWCDSLTRNRVTGALVGSVLGEKYLDRIDQGITDPVTATLEELLIDYTRSDIEPLFELADAFDIDPVEPTTARP